MFRWKRSAGALAMLVAVSILAGTVGAAGSGAPVGVSAMEMDGKVVVTWLPPDDTVALFNQTGCDSMNMSMSYVYSNFTTSYPNITVVLRGGGNDVGFAKWIAGESDVDQASRKISAAEKQQAEARGINVTETKVGVESVAVITDPSAGVANISFDQLRGLLSGSISNWKQLGGADLAVKVFKPLPEGSPYLFINKSVMAGSAFASTATTVGDGRALIERVANTSGAIGFVRAGYVNDSSGVRVLAVKSAAGAQAYSANDLNASYNGSYALSRYYSLYTNGTINGAQATWAAFILDPYYGQKILADNGFLPLREQDRVNSTMNIDVTVGGLSYHIDRVASDGSAVAFNVSTTHFVDSNVTTGLTYTYTVSTTNGSGHAVIASPVSVTLTQPERAPGTSLPSTPTNIGIFVLSVIGLVVVAVVAGMLLLKRR